MIPNYVEFVVIQLIFAPTQRKHLMMTRKRNTPSGTIYEANSWYFRALAKEKEALEPDTSVRFREWRIFSGNQDIFTVKNTVFEQMYIFLGVETCYWVFCKRGSPLVFEGSMAVPCSYCGCCIFSQYPKIVDFVKSHIKRQIKCEN